MELRHLKYFVVVAEEKSFSKAAKRLFISQPPLSRQIKQLENEMGAELFNRNQRPLQLTEMGEFIYQHAKQILSRTDNLKTLAQQMMQFNATFSIGFVPSVLHGLLPSMISIFRKQNPSVQVKLHELLSWQQVEALKTGQIDVGLGRLNFEDNAVNRVLLRKEKLVLAVPKGHKLINPSKTVSINELSHENILVYPKQERLSCIDHAFRFMEQHQTQPNQYTQIRELHIALSLVAANEGITLAPKTLSHIRTEDIDYLDILDQEITLPVILSCRHDDDSVLLSSFVDAIYSVYQQKHIDYEERIL